MGACPKGQQGEQTQTVTFSFYRKSLCLVDLGGAFFIFFKILILILQMN